MATGKIVQIIGAVVDVEFPQSEVPSVYDALNVTESKERLVLEVQQQLGGGVVRCIVMGSSDGLRRGVEVVNTGAPISVPVGTKTLGRIMNVLGDAIDERGEIGAEEVYSIHREAPSYEEQSNETALLETGVKVIDLVCPFAKGGKIGLFGGAGVGKTVNMMELVVVASASESAALQYLAPYAGCAMGEYFRDRGEDALIVYDDLSKQAVAYRQISLLLKRPPGREAFPGDVFYLHSRLLERAARVNEEYVERFTNGEVKGKTGSLTALPIIETQAGDVSAFVPTNVISITDGQIFLQTELFNAGVRPAVDPGISVSRVGGSAQTKIIKKLSGGIRTALAQYRELAAFAQFSSDLDEATKKQLDHGQKVTELMKQKQYAPMSVFDQALVIFAAERGYLADVELSKLLDFEAALLSYARGQYAEFAAEIDKTGAYNDEVEAQLKKLTDDFVATQTW